MNKDYIYTVLFNTETQRFTIGNTNAWVGEEVYDYEDDMTRNLDSDTEVSQYDGLEDILQMAIGHVNNILEQNKTRI